MAAVLTLAFGIVATTEVFSMVEGILQRPLPFPDQSRLVILADIVEGASYGGDTPGFSGLGSYQPATYELSGLGDPMQIGAAWLSAQMFPVLAE